MISGANVIGWTTTRWVLQAKNSWCRAATSSGGQQRDESWRPTVCYVRRRLHQWVAKKLLSLATQKRWYHFWRSNCFGCTLKACPKHNSYNFRSLAKNNYESWKNSFLSKLSNNTLVWNKSNPALPSHSILCLFLFKHRPPKFRDSANCPSQSCLAVAHFLI
jgi:hypothetical protein